MVSSMAELPWLYSWNKYIIKLIIIIIKKKRHDCLNEESSRIAKYCKYDSWICQHLIKEDIGVETNYTIRKINFQFTLNFNLAHKKLSK